MKRQILTLIAILLVATSVAHADESSKRAKIEELFVVMKMDRTMKQMIAQSTTQGQQMAKGIFGDQPMTDADKKMVDDYTAKSVALVSEALDWEKIRPEYVNLYASEYTEPEIDGILTFYKSAVGQTMLEKTPELLTKSGLIVNAHAQQLQPQMRQLMTDFMKQLTAAHEAKSSAK
ncbi:DUF2059 domain-containing protein [Granulicella arctica]|uniref:DUF2059 domain-containing protein n=1 Tax=Granulicella arctica TaxID=940613 RepID=UPI0021DFA869|nr:DUF2059 domain-containing protein [Granulicella arctica]